jgi:transglutaminase-like putative cysteine protease
MRLQIDATLDYYFPQRADVLLQLEVAQMPDQLLASDRLTVTSDTPLTPVSGQQGIGRRLWTAGEGRFEARYTALVDVMRAVPDLAQLAAVPRRELPGRVIHYLWASRYCQSDALKEFAVEQFGHLQGGAAVAAMAEWTRASMRYEPGCSDASTTAHDSFRQRQGICRDFAHVLISFVRAFDIPARMVSAYAWRLDPPDFHAVVEVYLDGGWHLVDATGLAPVEGLVRIGVGRDAGDISFMTVFGGSADLSLQEVSVKRVDPAADEAGSAAK